MPDYASPKSSEGVGPTATNYGGKHNKLTMRLDAAQSQSLWIICEPRPSKTDFPDILSSIFSSLDLSIFWWKLSSKKGQQLLSESLKWETAHSRDLLSVAHTFSLSCVLKTRIVYTVIYFLSSPISFLSLLIITTYYSFSTSTQIISDNSISTPATLPCCYSRPLQAPFPPKIYSQQP